MKQSCEVADHNAFHFVLSYHKSISEETQHQATFYHICAGQTSYYYLFYSRVVNYVRILKIRKKNVKVGSKPNSIS